MANTDTPADRARRAAQDALGVRFEPRPLVGFAGRSTIFLGDDAVLKVFAGRAKERVGREVAGVRLWAGIAGVRAPNLLGYKDSWLCMTRVAGAAATEPEWAGATGTDLVGRLAARLHVLPEARLADLPPHDLTFRELSVKEEDTYRAGKQLEVFALPMDRCVRGFVHGDLSSRNILLVEGQPGGVIDFEGCGVGCVYTDLATLYAKEVLLGARDGAALLAVYTEEVAVLGGAHAALDVDHLNVHLARYARWVLQWAPEHDPAFAADIIAVVPEILVRLSGAAVLRRRAERRQGNQPPR